MQIRPNFAALFVLLFASTTSLQSVTGQNETAAASGVLTPCPTLPQPQLTPHTPCPTLSQPSLPATSNSNYSVAAESDPVVTITALSPVVAPAPVTAAAATLTEAAASEVLPPALSCTPVSVKGDATYCISGRVCSGAGSNLPGTNCPKKGDVAIAHCWNTLTSYNAAGDNCVAPRDAQCVVIETGVWGCAFPTTATATAPLVSPTSEVAADADVESSTPMPLEIAPVQPPTVRVDSATTHGIVAANYASANYAFATNLETEQPHTVSTAGAAGTAGVNALVAVGALVVAVFGIVIAKTRQRDRLDTQNDSIRNIGCMELSTPI